MDLGEGEEGEGGEEEEGGMVGDDLEGGLPAQVEGGEDGQETLRGEQEKYRQEEGRRTTLSWLKERAVWLNEWINQNGSNVNCISVIAYHYYPCGHCQTPSSGHQKECTGEESQQVSA